MSKLKILNLTRLFGYMRYILGNNEDQDLFQHT